jgi:non-heme chloroperoxidase
VRLSVRVTHVVMATAIASPALLAAQEPAQPPTLKTVVVAQGVELHYVERGKGDPVILVHGGMADYSMWTSQIGPLAGSYRVIAYSRRYNSPNTNAVQPNYSPVVDAEDLAALIGKLGLARAHIVGSSLGGRVALFLAARHPDLVRSLVLQEAPIQFAGDPPNEGKVQNDRAMRLALERGDREAAVQRILDTVSGGQAKFRELPTDRQRWMLRNFEEMEAYLRNPAEPELERDAVRRIAVPTLLLAGERSPTLWRPIEDELLRLLPGGRRVVIRGAAHGMFRTHADQTNAAILQFLAGKR